MERRWEVARRAGPTIVPAVSEQCPRAVTRGRASSLTTVPAYLSPQWFAAADAALRADADLAARSRGVHLVLQQTVDDPAPGTTWHVRFDDGEVSLAVGLAADATVTFRCDHDTAMAVHAGTTSAQAAFMAGELHVGGDVGALLANQELLAGLTDVLAPLRVEVA